MRSDHFLTKLTKSRDYAALSSRGVRFPSTSWVIFADHGAVGLTPSVGVVASRKVGDAVTRNRAKRRLRALAREVLAGDARLNGMRLVMIARNRVLERDYQLLKRELRYCVAEILKQLQNSNQ